MNYVIFTICHDLSTSITDCPVLHRGHHILCKMQRRMFSLTIHCRMFCDLLRSYGR